MILSAWWSATKSGKYRRATQKRPRLSGKKNCWDRGHTERCCVSHARLSLSLDILYMPGERATLLVCGGLMVGAPQKKPTWALWGLPQVLYLFAMFFFSDSVWYFKIARWVIWAETRSLKDPTSYGSYAGSYRTFATASCVALSEGDTYT